MQLTKGSRDVLVIEQHTRIGGGCTHWGTIPSKALRYSIYQLTEALANQSLLRELRITWNMARGESDETLDLGFAAHLANLEVLVLDVHHGQAAKRLDALDFAPLRDLPKLRRLALPGWRGRHLNRARESLGPSVDVSH